MFLHLFAFFNAEAKSVGILLNFHSRWWAGGSGRGGIGGKNKTTKERVKFARRVRRGGGVETEFTLKRRNVRARSKGEERWRCSCRSSEPLIRFRDPDSAL